MRKPRNSTVNMSTVRVLLSQRRVQYWSDAMLTFLTKHLKTIVMYQILGLSPFVSTVFSLWCAMITNYV